MDIKKLGLGALGVLSIAGAIAYPLQVNAGDLSAQETFQVSFEDGINNTLEKLLLPEEDLIGMGFVNNMLKDSPSVELKGSIGKDAISLKCSKKEKSPSIQVNGTIGKVNISDSVLITFMKSSGTEEIMINGKKVEADFDASDSHKFTTDSTAKEGAGSSTLSSLTLKTYAVDDGFWKTPILTHGDLMQSASKEYMLPQNGRTVQLTSTRSKEAALNEKDAANHEKALSIKQSDIVSRPYGALMHVKGEYLSIVMNSQGLDTIVHPVEKKYRLLESDTIQVIGSVGDTNINYNITPSGQ